MRLLKSLALLAALANVAALAQAPNVADVVDPDTVTAKRFDMGKMWTFEDPPVEYFAEAYQFEPSDEWFENARLSALKLVNFCSASFVSSDGLIMTNHHCVRGRLNGVARDDENLLRDGFYAATLADERPMPGLYVDQLVLIEDVTEEASEIVDEGETFEERLRKEEETIQTIEARAKDDDDELEYRVVSLYNGGKYSLYGYRRYTDIRLVFVPELWTAKLGGDYDNFTYPRYGLDCAFLRAYEDGEPADVDDYFPWSPAGAKEGEPVFVVGNPGNTDRIKTVAQIQYDRDHRYPKYVPLLEAVYNVYHELATESEEIDFDLVARLYTIGNGLKVYSGMYDALLDEKIMARKRDFEKKFKAVVQNDPALNELYGEAWSELEAIQPKKKDVEDAMFGYSLNPYLNSKYFFVASDVVSYARQLRLPEDERDEAYREENLDATIADMVSAGIDADLERRRLAAQIDYIFPYLPEAPLKTAWYGTETGLAAADKMIAASMIATEAALDSTLRLSPDAILALDDPFVQFILARDEAVGELAPKLRTFAASEAHYERLLGKALFAVYGETIPPDATMSLRIADGVVSGYRYNGTRAPYKTTFYGALDRYHSFDGVFPYDLPKIWENLPPDFDPATPLNFATTNDIVGGNSGSAVINTKGEVVGLAFDGNIESLPNTYVYTTERNRTVAVHSAGMLEAIGDLYDAKRLFDELRTGELSD